MKKTAFLLLMPLGLLAQDEKSFTINGKLNNIADPIQKVYISYSSKGEWKRDSAEVKNNSYVLKGKISDPGIANLTVRYSDGQRGTGKKSNCQVFIEPAAIKIVSTDSFSNIQVSGSKAHADFLVLKSKQDAYTKIFNDISQEWYALNKDKEANKAAIKALEVRADSIENDMKEKVFKDFIEKKPKSPVALHALSQYAGYDINADKAEPLFMLLPVATQKTFAAQQLKEQIDIAKKTGIGKIAMDFTQNDTAGKAVSLSSFKGKYVLIDFWASWCGPCRVENPNVVKAFEQYKDKGFTVLGVALERPDAHEKWMDAIRADKLTWTQVSDFKYFDNEVAKQYGIRAIPQNLLLDPQGKIVAKNLRGEALQEKLAEIFGGGVATN